MEIRGSIAVVTGASAGIGRATGIALANRGARVVLAARRREHLEDLERFIVSRGGDAAAVACDVTDQEDIRRLADHVAKTFRRCDILVNNAGIPGGGSFDDLTDERIDHVVATNLLSVLHATKAFLPLMQHTGRGHIVNIASLAGRHPVPGSAVYSATKHAVVAFSESLHQETSRQGIAVTAVNPALVETEGFPQSDVPAMFVMRPEQVARAVAHVIERGQAPVVSVPRWSGALEVFRVAVPGPYRWASRRILLSRQRNR